MTTKDNCSKLLLGSSIWLPSRFECTEWYQMLIATLSRVYH